MKIPVIIDYLVEKSNGFTLAFDNRTCPPSVLLEVILRGLQVSNSNEKIFHDKFISGRGYGDGHGAGFGISCGGTIIGGGAVIHNGYGDGAGVFSYITKAYSHGESPGKGTESGHSSIEECFESVYTLI